MIKKMIQNFSLISYNPDLIMAPKLLLLIAETEMPKLVFFIVAEINYHNCRNFPKLFSGSSSQNTSNGMTSYAHSYKDYCKTEMFAEISF